MFVATVAPGRQYRSDQRSSLSVETLRQSRRLDDRRRRTHAIKVVADDASIDSAKAVSLGLIVTVLVINPVKYAFPTNKAGAVVTIAYRRTGTDWTLAVSDNGVGKITSDAVVTSGGLGTAIVLALAKQLDAQVNVVSGAEGMSVSIDHRTPKTDLPKKT